MPGAASAPNLRHFPQPLNRDRPGSGILPRFPSWRTHTTGGEAGAVSWVEVQGNITLLHRAENREPGPEIRSRSTEHVIGVVFPGAGYAGYYVLAIDLEGKEVCDWLTSKGTTCVLLKYRVPHTGPQWDDRCKCEMNPKAPMARSLS